MPAGTRLRCAGLVVFAAVLGCVKTVPPPTTVTRTYDKPVPDPPPAGQVRVVAEKVREDDTTVHWKWTVVGDRNWSGQSGSHGGVELTGAYPLNVTNRIGGTNAYECELVLSVARPADGKAALSCEYSLAGVGTTLSGAVNGYSAGGSVGGGGALWADMKPVALPKAVKVLLTGDQTLPLPLDVALVEVSAASADGRPLRHTFRLKASE